MTGQLMIPTDPATGTLQPSLKSYRTVAKTCEDALLEFRNSEVSSSDS